MVNLMVGPVLIGVRLALTSIQRKVLILGGLDNWILQRALLMDFNDSSILV